MAAPEDVKPMSPEFCRAKPCHYPNGCYRAGSCQYKSSAEESNEIRKLTMRTTNMGGPAPVIFTETQRPGNVIACPPGAQFMVIEGSVLPEDSKERKEIPLARGVLDYFPAALAAVARLSKKGNDKHNPGQDIHWARGKSTDHADCILRHLIDRGTIDPEDGESHSVKLAWRALALLQEELEAKGAPMSRGSRNA